MCWAEVVRFKKGIKDSVIFIGERINPMNKRANMLCVRVMCVN